MDLCLELGHRGGLLAADARYCEPDLFVRLGGAEVVGRLVDELYDGIEADRQLRRLFGGREALSAERRRQRAFWTEWLGGPLGTLGEHHGAGLRLPHHHLYLSRGSADRWLTHFTAAAEAAVADADARDRLLGLVAPLARALVNRIDEPGPGDKLRCTHPPGYLELLALVQREDAAPLAPWAAAVADWPQNDRDDLLQAAVLAGRLGPVRWLLDSGADVNHAAPNGDVSLTPLAAALWRGHGPVATLLRARGARYDIFTAALLGDVAAVRAMVEAEPRLLEAEDPASDVQRDTPLHHAVYGGRLAVARDLLARGARPASTNCRQLAWAARDGHVELVRLLLEHGAPASGIGPGRWVVQRELAPLLLAAGATADRPEGRWIHLSCTGNNRQQDDPAYVAALLDCGAAVQSRLRGATALHYAAKAGFLGTLQVLLARGADVEAVDDRGRTPLVWVARSGKRVDRDAVRRCLRSGRGG